MAHPSRRHLEALIPNLGRSSAQGSAGGAPLVPGIVQSTTFPRGSLDSDAPHAYSRQSNPTVSALESALGQLEGAPAGVAFSTGLGAEAALFWTLLSAGDHVVCSESLYGGTTRILQQLFPRFGVNTSFVDSTDPQAVHAALRPETRLVFLETPSNPTLRLTDIAAVSAIAHAVGAKVVVDNTFLTPLLQQPLALGADLTVTSTTKFVEGHSAALGGALVSHDEELLERLRFVRTCTGGIQTPFQAWLTLQGLKTLGVRLERQSETARGVAVWLAERPEVRVVCHPSLARGEQLAIAQRQHRGADGAVVAFELADDLPGVERFLSGIRAFPLVEHVGSVETLLTHSASMTHAAVDPSERLRLGVSDGLLRISVGLEPLDSILAGLDEGFAALGRSNTLAPAAGGAKS